MFQAAGLHDHHRPAGLAGAVADPVARALRPWSEARNRGRSPFCCAGPSVATCPTLRGRWAIVPLVLALRARPAGRQPVAVSISRRRIHSHLNEGSITPANDSASQHLAGKIDRNRKGNAAGRDGVSGSPHGGLQNRPVGNGQRSSGAECQRSRRLAPPDGSMDDRPNETALDDAIPPTRLNRVPGANFLISQPIQQRVDELLSGVRSEATVKVIGEDLDSSAQYGGKDSGHHDRHQRREGCACGATLRAGLSDHRYRSGQDRAPWHQCRPRSGKSLRRRSAAEAATRVYEGQHASI